MVRTCSTYKREEIRIQNSSMERDVLKDLGVDDRIY
jgi:hypothetical protein